MNENQQTRANDPGRSAIKKAAFYGRYSTSMQRPASIEDQKRACDEFAASAGMVILEDHTYSDSAKSGTTKAGRPGFDALEKAMRKSPKPFDYILFDDTSRCARDVEDILRFTKVAAHRKIGVHFVSQNLNSSTDDFALRLQIYAVFDEQYISRLKKRVFQSQKGRVLAGYHSGSEAYGYRSVRVANPDLSSASGQAATLGSKLVIVEEEAEVVRRIFQLFNDGTNATWIAKTLNREKVPSPQNARAGRTENRWSRDPIGNILANEKYKGTYTWNLGRHEEDPETGKTKKVPNAAHEVIRLDRPEIRIVSDEIWYAAEARRNVMKDKQTRRVEGGYNRAVNQPYLYSGFLFCGYCKEKLIVNGLQGKGRYKCANHRMHRGCENFISISAALVATQLTKIISERLRQPPVFDDLVTEVMKEVKLALEREANAATKADIPLLEEQRRVCEAAVMNLLDSLELNSSDAMMARLRERERELVVVQEKLRIARGQAKVEVTRESLASLLEKNVGSLLEVLESNVPLARMLLGQHQLRLYLTPELLKTKEIIHVEGDANLFAEAGDKDAGVLLGVSGTRNPQQHAIFSRGVLSIESKFMNEEIESCEFYAPLCEALRADPSLSLDFKKPGEWAEIVKRQLGDRYDPKKKLGYGAIGQCFRVHHELLSEGLLIEKVRATRNPGHLYRVTPRETVRAALATGPHPEAEVAGQLALLAA